MDDDSEDLLQVSALKWLADTGRLEQLQKQCAGYTAEAEKTRVVFKFVFRLDPTELLQYNAQLGDLILHCPRQAWRLFQQVCFSSISSMGWLPPFFSSSQLLLILRLDSLPDLPGYAIEHVSELPLLTTEPRFYMFHGIVCGMSTMEKYTQHACFSCPNEACTGEGEEGSKYIRLHVAGASEATTVSNGDFTCYHCGTQLIEDVSLRALASKLKFHLVPPKAMCMSESALSPERARRYQALTMVVRDELCERVRMGGSYTVIGVPMYELAEGTQQSFISTTIEVNNILPYTPPSGLKFGASLPASLMEMYQACQYSPWVFAATLAYSFAAEVCPPGSYHKLKLALLLSLVNASDSVSSQETKAVDPTTFSHVPHSRFPVLDLLTLGSDTVLLLQLLLYSSSLAPRSILHSSTNSLLGTVRKDNCGSIFIDGGSLVLAEGGICVVGNLSSQKKDVRDTLQKTLETEKVTVTMPKRLGVKDTQQVTWPLRGTVWACADQQQRNKVFSKADSEVIRAHSIQETLSLSKAFTDRMSIVMVTNPPVADSADYLSEMLTQHLLQAASGQPHVPVLPHNDFKQFLTAASSLQVQLSPEAKHMLQSFYIASRHVRTSSVHSSDMPNSALDSMCALALAHARLSLRTEAIEADAVLAISLYEESLASRLGYSVLNIAPVPHFKDDDISQYIGKKYDSSMRLLHERITQFCKCHVFGSLIDMPEE